MTLAGVVHITMKQNVNENGKARLHFISFSEQFSICLDQVWGMTLLP